MFNIILIFNGHSIISNHICQSYTFPIQCIWMESLLALLATLSISMHKVAAINLFFVFLWNRLIWVIWIFLSAQCTMHTHSHLKCCFFYIIFFCLAYGSYMILLCVIKANTARMCCICNCFHRCLLIGCVAGSATGGSILWS